MLQLMFVCSDAPTTAYPALLAPSAMYAFKDILPMLRVYAYLVCPTAEDAPVKPTQYV